MEGPAKTSLSRRLMQASRMVKRETFHVDVNLLRVSNVQTGGPLRRLALRWQRGERTGTSSAAYPHPLQPGDESRTYEFKDTVTVSSQLFQEGAGWAAKELCLSLLEVDPSGKKADAIGWLSLNLAQLVGRADGVFGPPQTLSFTFAPNVSSASRPRSRHPPASHQLLLRPPHSQALTPHLLSQL